MAYAKPDRLFLRKFGLRVRKLREAAGWSQEDFAEHCNLHRTYVGSIERGERNVAPLKVMKKNYWNNQTGKLNISAILQAASEKDKRQALNFLLKYFGYRLAQTG